MCVTATVGAGIAAAGAVGSLFGGILSANTKKNQALYQAALEAKQLKEQRDIAFIQATQQETAKTDAFMRAKSSALAAIGGAGMGENISFYQSLDEGAKKAWLNDVRNTRLNLAQTNSTIADQIQANGYGVRIAKQNFTTSLISTGAQFAQQIASAAMGAANGAVPSGGGGGGGASWAPVPTNNYGYFGGSTPGR